ncbi:MAG: hypothetical protein R3B69_01025 [Candidatus Paceibacterota bacterium]
MWVGLLMSSPSLVVYAQTTTANTSSENSVSTLSPAEQQRIFNLAANVSNKIEAATTRLYDIIDRMERRARKLAASGAEYEQTATGVAEGLANERNELTRVTSALEGIDQRMYEAVTAADPKTAWEEASWYFYSAQVNLKRSYERTITNLMILKDPTTPLTRPDTAETASSTESTSSSTPQTATSTASTTNETSS